MIEMVNDLSSTSEDHGHCYDFPHEKILEVSSKYRKQWIRAQEILLDNKFEENENI